MHIGRGLGIVVVFLSVNITTEVLTELGLWLGRSGWSPLETILGALGAGFLVGSLFAYRYWHATEYDLRRVYRAPIYCCLALLLVVLVSGFLLPGAA